MARRKELITVVMLLLIASIAAFILLLTQSNGQNIQDEDASFPTPSVHATSTPAPILPACPTPETGTVTPVAPTLEPAETPTRIATPPGERDIQPPVQIVISAIGVDAIVEWVGLDDAGRMRVPSSYETVAWYEEGTRPGMPGNAVIAGHLDSRAGPAVFYGLENLKAGDEIIIFTQDGEELRFEVLRLELFNTGEAPVHEIFGPSDTRNLNLVTCHGVFDPSVRQYDKRLVVFSIHPSD
jgi:hypothetical protein